ncbi:unnamed protein product [Lactuca virosa]|uniref:Uncharacterized protein n=1 Tax=Lactuca virosa TaxID=75947 RepID=A0AAU9N8D3_9ASTR|nr:unnamed protein product [Lactuca virosa]
MMAENNFDLNHLRIVAEQDGQSLTEKEGLSFLKTSALEAHNVEKIFQTILTDIYHIVSKKALAAQEASGPTPLPGQGTTSLIHLGIIIQIEVAIQLELKHI